MPKTSQQITIQTAPQGMTDVSGAAVTKPAQPLHYNGNSRQLEKELRGSISPALHKKYMQASRPDQLRMQAELTTSEKIRSYLLDQAEKEELAEAERQRELSRLQAEDEQSESNIHLHAVLIESAFRKGPTFISQIEHGISQVRQACAVGTNKLRSVWNKYVWPALNIVMNEHAALTLLVLTLVCLYFGLNHFTKYGLGLNGFLFVVPAAGLCTICLMKRYDPDRDTTMQADDLDLIKAEANAVARFVILLTLGFTLLFTRGVNITPRVSDGKLGVEFNSQTHKIVKRYR